MRKLDAVNITEIVAYIKKNVCLAHIAAHYKVSPSRISQLKRQHLTGAKVTKTKEYTTDDMGVPINDGVEVTITTHPAVMPRGGFGLGMAMVKKEGTSSEF